MTGSNVHVEVLELEADDGEAAAAPGAAVTVALCAHWRHEGACRWPHRTDVVSRSGRVIEVRVAFDAPPPEIQEVRSRIAAALERGEQAGPDGRVHRWRIRRDGAVRGPGG